MAGKRNAGNKRPSMFEVAKLAGVSHQTVSRVINHSPDVSDATREKVQKAIDQLGYRPSNSARALASHRSRTIGLIAGGDCAFVKAVEGAEDSCTLGAEDLQRIHLQPPDLVIGLAASGRTP